MSAGPVRPRLRLLLRCVCWALLLFVFVKYAVWAKFLTPGATGVDYPKHHRAAIALLEGENPYRDAGYQGHGHLYYPQFAIWCFLFLAAFGEAEGELYWNLAMALFIVAAVGLAAFGPRPRPDPPRPGAAPEPLRALLAGEWPAAMALAFALFTPLFLDLPRGNVGPLIVLMMTGLTLALRRERPLAAGLLLAAASLFKILPALLGPLLWLARRRRAALAWAGALAAYGLLLLALGTWRWELDLFTRSLPFAVHAWHWLSYSLVTIGVEWLRPDILEDPVLYSRLARAVTLGVFALHGVCVWVGRRGLREHMLLAVAHASLAIVLASPVLEYHHLCFAFPAWLLLWSEAATGRWRGRFCLGSGLLWLALLGCRHWQDLTPGDLPLKIATGLLALLWLHTGREFATRGSQA